MWDTPRRKDGEGGTGNVLDAPMVEDPTSDK